MFLLHQLEWLTHFEVFMVKFEEKECGCFIYKDQFEGNAPLKYSSNVAGLQKIHV